MKAFQIINGVGVIDGMPIEYGRVIRDDLFRLLCDNGYSISVAFHHMAYCDGGVTTAEVAVFNPKDEFFAMPGESDDVIAHQTGAQVMDLWKEVQGF
jgi:hypothetical protein